VKLLDALRNALSEKKPASYDKYNAEHRREEREQTTLNLLKNEVAERSSERDQARRHRNVERCTLLVSLITMCAVIYYAGVTRLQLGKMEGTYQEAKRSADIAERQQQPWVGLEQNTATPVNSPEYAWSPALPHPTIYASLRYSLKNYGASLALWVNETMHLDPVPERGMDLPHLRQVCRIDIYRAGQVTIQGDVGEMILPGASKLSSYGTSMRNNLRTPQALKRVWITLCVLYQDPRGIWHFSGYRFISSHAGATPAILPGHPGWSYLPFTGVSLIAADAN
jgi:hypothetical protein